MASPKKAQRRSGIVQMVRKHPVGTAAVAAGAVAGAVLLRKAANTAAKVVTIKAAADAAKDVVGAVNRRAGQKKTSARRKATTRAGGTRSKASRARAK
jgi:hypothetical protein